MNEGAKNALHQAWFPAQAQTSPPDGLTTLRQALIAMEGREMRSHVPRDVRGTLNA